MISSHQQYYLQAMGITPWVERDVVVVEEPSQTLDTDAYQIPQQESPTTVTEQDAPIYMFGSGNQQAKLMIVMEASHESNQHLEQPFAGNVGQLLTAMLAAIGQTPRDVYIVTMATAEQHSGLEEKYSAEHISGSINKINPTLLLVLGKVAANQLLNTTEKMSDLRGQRHHHKETNTPVIVTYHPAYLLKKPTEKANSWIDLQPIISDLT